MITYFLYQSVIIIIKGIYGNDFIFIPISRV